MVRKIGQNANLVKNSQKHGNIIKVWQHQLKKRNKKIYKTPKHCCHHHECTLVVIFTPKTNCANFFLKSSLNTYLYTKPYHIGNLQIFSFQLFQRFHKIGLRMSLCSLNFQLGMPEILCCMLGQLSFGHGHLVIKVPEFWQRT